MRSNTYLVWILLFLLWGQSIYGQLVTEDFNKSVNQIGGCWQMYNMTITTKNTINSGSNKKALTGTNVNGNPAYHFTTPLMNFYGSGNITFRHKLDFNNGTHREFHLQVLDDNMNVVNTIYNYMYIDSVSGTTPNGNPTNVQQPNIAITWSGNYHLRFYVISSGGSSFFMVDDIRIDAFDIGNTALNNGYGLCRQSDTLYDTICAGSLATYRLPVLIPDSDWDWSFNGASGGSLDSTVVNGPRDSIIDVNWNGTADGDYEIIAREYKSGSYTSYSVHYAINVIPQPAMTWSIDSVCEGEMHTATIQFTNGTGPWEVTFEDDDSTFTKTFTNSTSTLSLGVYQAQQTMSVQSILGSEGCYGDVSGMSRVIWIRGKPILGPIWHY